MYRQEEVVGRVGEKSSQHNASKQLAAHLTRIGGLAPKGNYGGICGERDVEEGHVRVMIRY